MCQPAESALGIHTGIPNSNSGTLFPLMISPSYHTYSPTHWLLSPALQHSIAIECCVENIGAGSLEVYVYNAILPMDSFNTF